jgi:hypothetical protein
MSESKSLMDLLDEIEEEPSSPARVPEIKQIKPKITKTPIKTPEPLTFEQIRTKLIEYGKNSKYQGYKDIYMTLTGKSHNANFQSKKIDNSLRMLLDIGLSITEVKPK